MSEKKPISNFIFGGYPNKRDKFFTNNSKIPLLTEIEKFEEIYDIIGGGADESESDDDEYGVIYSSFDFLIQTGKSEVHYIKNENSVHKLNFGNKHETIKKIAAQDNSYAVLCDSGSLYWITRSKNQKEIHSYCSSDSESSSFSSDDNENESSKKSMFDFQKETFFEKKNLQLDKIAFGGWQCLYLCSDGKLFVQNRFLGNLKKSPKFLRDDVTNIYINSPTSKGSFFTTKDNKLYGMGYNSEGQLGLGNRVRQTKPALVPKFKADQILNIVTTYWHTLLLTNDGLVYATGIGQTSRQNNDLLSFHLVEQLKDYKTVQISAGLNNSIAYTSDNKLFVWTFYNSISPLKDQLKDSNTPTELIIPNVTLNQFYRISSSSHNAFIYLPPANSILEDFKDILKSENSKLFFDSQINEFNVHKALMECRLNKNFNEIKLKLKKLKKGQTKALINWIYTDCIDDKSILKEIFKLLEIPYPPKFTLQQDLLKLYQKEESKDFNLLVKDVDEDVENDENEQDSFEKISVHKFILLIRSGLFREMFSNISNNENNLTEIKDYSNKTVDSLEILIKYFYTDEISLTADHDPILIYEELQNAQEYYQLNTNNNFLLELEKMKKKYNIKK
ncbi:rcc1 and btb domain-containing protein [Anaeramoeba flamelloides]|uniref:Rcc1 and btb domain-containing protein n=1 Tax=Anaeramoeba flamelloides TaxID=1746091 RepID=A0AAV8A897_9EUKA|nr:rcc1 and btb domain-containing protein [Anaeramoeba flamelloides]